jgi:hypothetical protein
MALFTRPSLPPSSRPVIPAVPASLTWKGRTLLHSGPGRSPGSHVYLDLATGSAVELYRVRVEYAQPGYLLARVEGNPALGLVRCRSADVSGGAGTLRPGALLLAGPLRFDGDGMAGAEQAWPISARASGVINRIHASGSFGEITTPAGARFFFHVSQLPPGVSVRVGQGVTFVETVNDRGPAALDVRPC